MVFIEIGSVVMLTTSHTATTGVLAMLPYTTVTGGYMAAARKCFGQFAISGVEENGGAAFRKW